MKSDKFLSDTKIAPVKTIDAKKERFDPKAALKLLRAADRVVVAKGKKVLDFDLSSGVTDEELLAAVIGPSGNLRAPTIRVGKTMGVGFSEEAFRLVLGR